MHVRYYILFTLIFSCATEDTLVRQCPDKCWAPNIPGSMQDVGQCTSGTPVCDDDNFIIDCLDAGEPSTEECDNIDNDCDGENNEHLLDFHPILSSIFYHDAPNPCHDPIGECYGARVKCTHTGWECTYPITVELEPFTNRPVPQESRCDGLDGNCDYLIDNDIYAGASLKDRVCYSGPAGTELVGDCTMGALSCIKAETICYRERTPSIERCGDGLDNDCDGWTDEIENSLVKYDIVFIIDTSGSMCDVINAVAQALSRYISQFASNPNFRFALVIMSTGASSPPYVSLKTDFTDIATLQAEIANLDCNGHWYEASLDSMAMVCDKTSNVLNLDWDPDADALFFAFTDEGAQSYMTPQTTGQSIIDTCLAHKVLPYMWSWSNSTSEFEYIVASANGEYFSLVPDVEKIFNDMNSVMITLCDPEDQ